MIDLVCRSWWVLATRGGVALAFGVLALLLPAVTIVGLVFLFAFFALAVGVVSVIGAYRQRASDRAWRIMLLVGLTSLAAGLATLLIPGLTVLLFVMLMALNAIAVGVLDIVFAMRLRKRMRREWPLAVAGGVSVAFGALAFIVPAAGVAALVWLVSAYAIATGGLLLAVAVRARKWREELGGDTAAPGLELKA